MAQKDRVLNYIDSFGSITSLEAFRDCGITRLAARVNELRRDGVQIDSVRENSKNRFGESVSYARYFRAGDDRKNGSCSF